MIHVTGSACYVIYGEHNARFSAKDQRRKFLKELANIPSIETRSCNRMVMKSRFLRGAVEMVLGRQIVTSRKNAAVTRAPHGSRGPTTIVGSCCVCLNQKRKQQKNRKSCVICGQLVRNKHSVSKTISIPCENE